MVPPSESPETASDRRPRQSREAAAVALVVLLAGTLLSLRRSAEAPITTIESVERAAPGLANPAPPADAAAVTRILVDMTPPPGAKSDYPLGVNATAPPGKVTFATDSPKRMAFPSMAAGSLLPARVCLLESAAGKYRNLRTEEVWSDRERTHLIARHTMVGDHLLVSAAEGVDATRLRLSLPDTFAIRGELRSGGTFLISFPVETDGSLPAARMALEKLGPALVRRIEPDTFVHLAAIPNDPLFTEQWGLHNTGQNGGTPDADIDAPEAWELRTDATGFPIAVIDTGIDHTHPDLAANIWTNAGETGADKNGQDRRTNGVDDDANGYIDDWRGWDFANDDNNPSDDNGHGTQVAGIIGAEGNNNEGIAGVCWSCDMMPLKALSSSGSGAWSDIINAVEYAKTMKARVGNLSFGAYGAAPEEAKRAFAAANETLWCAAAGNGELPHNGNQIGDDLDEFHFFPACLDVGHLLAVTAIDSKGQFAEFANFGRFMVDVAAPGVGIRSTLPDGGYGLASGTSMAAAYVTGLCALAHPLRMSPYPINIRQLALATVKRSNALRNKLVTGGRMDAGLFMTQAKARMAWQSITSSTRFSLQIRPDGTVMAWGNRQFIPSAIDQGSQFVTVPVEVPLPLDARSVHANSSGEAFAILSDGSLWTWGAGELPHPLAIANVRFLVTQDGTEETNASGKFALKTDGSVWSWGGSSLWRTTDSVPPDIPGRIAFERPIVQLTHLSFLDDAGRLFTGSAPWAGISGELPVLVAGLPPLDRFTDAVYGGSPARAILARTASGEAYGWGSNMLLGLPYDVTDPYTAKSPTPVRLPGWDGYLHAWEISGGIYGTMPGGRVVYSGNDYDGTALLTKPWPLSTAGAPFETGLSDLTDLQESPDDGVIFMLDRFGAVKKCELAPWWSRQGVVQNLPTTHPVAEMWLARGDSQDLMLITAEFTGIYHGNNEHGQAGIGVEAQKNRPVELTRLRGAKHISSMYTVMQDGSLRAYPGLYGVANYFFPGESPPENAVIPTPSGGRVKQSADDGLLLVMEDGGLWQFQEPWNSPNGTGYSQVTTPSPAISVVQGFSVFNDETRKSQPSRVVLADGRMMYRPENSSEFVIASDTFTMFTSSMGLKHDGTVWEWRDGSYQQMPGLSHIAQISSSPIFPHAGPFAALRCDGRILVMGSFPGAPRPADGSPLMTPTLVDGVSNIVQVAAGTNHLVALRSDGQVFVWGNNNRGQLGVGDNLSRDSVQQPFGLSNVTQIWVMGDSNIAKRADGTFWGWGGNSGGVLRDGSARVAGVSNLAYGAGGTVFNAGNGFTDWLTTNFNEQELRDIELSADAKDPDDDGLSNLLEYALGTNPRKYTAGNTGAYEPVPPPTPTYEITSYVPYARLEKVRRNYYMRGVGIAGEGDDDPETTHLVMTVSRAARRSDVDYIIEVSDDLQNWHFGTGHTVEVQDTLTSLVVYDARPLEENPSRFIRLRLVRNNPGQTSIPR